MTGAAFSASIKGGSNGAKGKWEPPKDWDWSVTPGRLIPVSEATDDVPTPGYRMSQLQQRIPPNHGLQPFPITNVEVTNNTSDEKVVVIGQRQATAGVNVDKVSNDLSTTQRQETTENIEQSTPKEIKPQSALDEQELILLHDEPIVDRRESLSFETPSTTEKVPVVEELMEKVELPEICSISGIGCRDPKPVEPRPEVQTTTEMEEHTEVLKHPKVVPHPHVVSHPEVQKSTEEAAIELTTEQSTVHHAVFEEHTTGHDQLSSDSHHVDHQVVQQVQPVSPFSEAPEDESFINNTSVPVAGNETESSEETVSSFLPDFNHPEPTIVHSVISSVSEHVGFSSKKNNSDSNVLTNSTDSQHEVDDAQVQLQQQEQQVQQVHVYSPEEGSQEAEVRQVDEQKLLEIANSWGSSSENSSTHSFERRMDEPEHEETREHVVTEVSVAKEEVASQEAVITGHEMKNMTHSSEQKNSTESPSLGDRLESYWKAATGYVSKALNL